MASLFSMHDGFVLPLAADCEARVGQLVAYRAAGQNLADHWAGRLQRLPPALRSAASHATLTKSMARHYMACALLQLAKLHSRVRCCI